MSCNKFVTNKKSRLILALVILLAITILMWFAFDALNTKYRYMGIEVGDLTKPLTVMDNAFSHSGTTYVVENYYGDCICIVYYVDPDIKTGVITDVELVRSWQIRKTDASFEKIKQGMSVYEVTRFVGLPDSRSPTGLFGTDYTSSEGNLYRIVWGDGKVSSVYKNGEKITP